GAERGEKQASVSGLAPEERVLGAGHLGAAPRLSYGNREVGTRTRGFLAWSLRIRYVRARVSTPARAARAPRACRPSRAPRRALRSRASGARSRPRGGDARTAAASPHPPRGRESWRPRGPPGQGCARAGSARARPALS